jgi:GNAT superfamily N-acetyltransferase
MKIELGTTSDIPFIMETINECIIDLRNKGIYQWNEHYPPKEIIIDDIAEKHLHIIKNHNYCIAVIVINEDQDNEWNAVAWSEYNMKPLAIHRLMVHPEYQNRGIGRTLINFAIEYAIDNKYDSLRFDVYSGNPLLINTYEKMGCIKKGEVLFPYRDLPFYCYELDL